MPALALAPLLREPPATLRPSRAVTEIDDLTLARAKRGEASAFRAIVVAYQGPVHALLGRMLLGVASRAEVEELAQETFVRAYRSLGAFDSRGPGRLRKWVLTIATHIAIDALRARKPPSAQLIEEAFAHASSADEGLREKALAETLSRALSALPEDQRAVLLLREVHELEYEEIAEALGIAIGTVRSRLSRARDAMRLALKESHDV